MFQEYLETVESAVKIYKDFESEYDTMRQNLTMDIKGFLENEASKIEEGLELKDYSPKNLEENMKKLIEKFEKINRDQESDFMRVKTELDESLLKMMCNKIPKQPVPKTLPIKEVYKVIGPSFQNNNKICRVWFTLYFIKKWNCNPGDPIRIEWVDLRSYSSKTIDDSGSIVSSTERTDPGENGLKIPKFNQAGKITDDDVFYTINHWGENSIEKKSWNNWLKLNKPI